MSDTDEQKQYIQQLMKYIENMSPKALTNVERVLQLVYMSEKGELDGSTVNMEYLFSNCKITVFFGGGNGDRANQE